LSPQPSARDRPGQARAAAPGAAREPLRVLFVEDRPSDVELCLIELRNAGFDVTADTVETREQFEAKLRTGRYDVVLSDYRLPGWTGLDALTILRGLGRALPFILVTGSLGDEAAVDCVKGGAADYVIKDRLARLPVAVRQALEQQRLRHGQAVAVKALETSEERYRSLVEHSTDAILLMVDGRWAFANQAAARLFGAARRDDLVGRPLIESVEPAVRAEVLARIEHSASTGEVNQPIERRLVRLDGSMVDVDVLAIPMTEGVKVGAQVIIRDITARKQLEDALKEREERFRQITENIREAFYMVKADLSELLYVSPAYEQIVGRSCESVYRDLTGFFSVIHPDDRALVMEDIASIRRGVEVDGREFRVIRPDGAVRWVLGRTVPVRNAAGEVYRLAGVALDITERKRAEASLSFQNLLLSTQQETSLDGILVVDEHATIVSYNRRFLQLWEIPPTIVASREDGLLLEFVRDQVEDPEAFLARVAYLYAHPSEKSHEELRLRDGRTLDRYSAAMIGADDKYYGRVWYFRDISERRQAEEGLRRSEAEFRELVEHAPLGIYRSTRSGRFLTVNPALIKMLGYGWAEEMLRLDIARDVYADPAERERLIRESPNQTEVLWKRRDGACITVRLTSRGIPTPAGGEECYEGLVEDVTEQRNLENQFRQAQRMEAVGRLAGGVAHDFNNVLTAITGYSDLLLEDLGPEDPKRTDVEEIKAAALRAAALTRQLLAFSRKQVLQTRVLDLNEVVRTLDSMLHRLIGEDVKLELALASALGAVRADPGQIEQVILNLAVNSRDAMPSGGKLTVETANVELDDAYVREHTGATPGRFVMLAVSDTGIGMDAETRAHIFEPFFTTKELGKGTGLGLATVYGIVKQSGGYVWVYSEPGRGATFKIYLPLVDAVPDTAGLPVPVQPVTGGRETVLVAEDDPSVRAVVSDVLTQKGYRVLRAPDGQAALEMARSHPAEIHILLTDIVMPGMTGRELAEALVAVRPGVRVLYMSGYTDDAVVRHGVLEEGMPYLQKPFAPRALASKVREVLDRE
jgi:two-component system, cell cycle sensor histidine kinase and response regulator CckA